MTYMCVGCGKQVEIKVIEGSMKHPYCKTCFKGIWNNNYDKYCEWLDRTH